MKIYSAEQIKEWDHYTIVNEPVPSVGLMERAAKACYTWLKNTNFNNTTLKVLCGKGNNGGDGLALAAMLSDSDTQVSVYIAEAGQSGSQDFQHYLTQLQKKNIAISFLRAEGDFPPIDSDDVVIDALFGTGLNTPPQGLAAGLIRYINRSGATVISIDIPSGLYADLTSVDNEIIKATYTLCFQVFKLSFMVAENEPYFGRIELLDINLHAGYYGGHPAKFEVVDINMIRGIYRPRRPFSHKGNYGHALLVAGSYGMMGAAVLAARACIKSGVGKLTCAVCSKGYDIMQISVPEAMCKVYGNTYLKHITDEVNYEAAGIGPGLGKHKSHQELLQLLFKKTNKAVIDADALNVIADHKELLAELPRGCVITPHPKEFERLFGRSANDFERLELALASSQQYQIHIILKGHRTLITTPDRKAYFNSTGNAGMAKGGSGDLLTGILTGLLAQDYSIPEACLLGVYLHGLAGDIAAKKFSQEAMIASDIADCLGEGFMQLRG